MNIFEKIKTVVDPDEFKTGKSIDDGDKKRARARLNQIDIEMTQLDGKIELVENEIIRLREKMKDKELKYEEEVKVLIELLS